MEDPWRRAVPDHFHRRAISTAVERYERERWTRAYRLLDISIRPGTRLCDNIGPRHEDNLRTGVSSLDVQRAAVGVRKARSGRPTLPWLRGLAEKIVHPETSS